MAIGPGKYDKECGEIMVKTKADGVILIITDGDRGTGFSCQFSSFNLIGAIPQVLRQVADSIEADYKRGKL